MLSARILAIFALASVLLVAGCGGGGTTKSVPVQTASPSISVDWPQRSRDLLGPSSALSVTFTLQPLVGKSANIVFSGNRSSNLAAHTDTFTATTTTAVGEYNLTANFYANAGETGAVVGTASAQVDVSPSGAVTQPDGAQLAYLAFTPTIKSTTVAAGQTVPFFSTANLVATAYDASNNIVVVTPGSYTWTQTSGSTSFSLTSDGIATPLASGSGTVTAAIDGITSSPATVTVSPGTLVFNYAATSFAFDSARSCFYAGVSNYSSGGGTAILKINPANGSILSSVAVPVAANLLVVSLNDSHLYAVGVDGSITQIGLASFSVAGSASLPAGTFGASAVALPGSSDSWLVSTRDSNFNDTGTFVYDSLTPRPTSLQIGLSIDASQDGSGVFGYQALSPVSPRLYSYSTINSSGISLNQTFTPSFQGSNTFIHDYDSVIVADDGTVLDPTTGTTLRSFGITQTGHVAAGTATSSRVYFAVFPNPAILSCDIGTGDTVSTYQLPNTVTGTLTGATYVGPGSVAFANSGGASNQFFLTAGLP